MGGSRPARAVLVLLALALAGVAHCRHLPLSHTPRTAGRSLLQNECNNSFVQKLGLCVDVVQRVPGSPCCAGMQALDSGCLSAALASLSSPGGDSASANDLKDILESCGVTLPPTPAPAPGAGPADAPAPAAPAPAASDPPTAAPSPEASPSATQLPDGDITYSWSYPGDPGGTVCTEYTSDGWPEKGSGPQWVATGSAMPSDAEIKAAADPWCNYRTGAADAWMQALAASGRSAQVAMAALSFYSCADGAQLWDWLGDAVFDHSAMGAQATALQYHQAMVAAADASGIHFCAVLVVLDPSSGSVLFNQAIHVGPGPNTPEGCLPGFQQSLTICGDATSAPGTPCCAALGALGDSCRATLAVSTDANVTNSYGQLASGCNLSNATSALPVGDVYISYTTSGAAGGRAATCETYSTITDRWTDLTNSTWGPSVTGSVVLPSSDIQALAAQVCSLGEGAGPALLEAVRAGGLSAQAAAAAVATAVSGAVCSEQSAQNAVEQAFLDAVGALTPTEALSVTQTVVEAWDAMGVGACVTLLVWDPKTKTALHEEYIHTLVFVPPVGSPPPAAAAAAAARSALGSVAGRGRRSGGRAVR